LEKPFWSEMDFIITGPLQNQSSVCVPILRNLPDWFGIEEAILDYERGNVVGFLSLKQHNLFSAEILVMAVHPEAQCRGIGRALVAAAENHVRLLGIEYMQVKTLGPSRPDEGYARTRAFYDEIGYRPLEELTKIWDDHNPCLIMIKSLTS
jgi:ribosomal protein S18 acetylase RimI-like enzyme